jgi:hypothetical protein
MPILLIKALDGVVNELAVEIVAYQIDSATTKAATHNA